MKFINNFLMLLICASFSCSAQATQTNLLADDPNLATRLVALNIGTPEEDLRMSYEDIININNLNNLTINIQIFNNTIHFPMDMTAIQDQQNFIDEAVDIYNKLSTYNGLFKLNLMDSLCGLGSRINLAKIDQQLFNQNGVRGVNHGQIQLNYQAPLSMLAGSVFHITQRNGFLEEVRGVGSAILASFWGGLPLDLQRNTEYSLNGIITCSHVLATNNGEHIEVYFVPHRLPGIMGGVCSVIDEDIGLPLLSSDGGDITTPDNLIAFLKKDPRSFHINTYNVKNRVTNRQWNGGIPTMKSLEEGTGNNFEKSFLGNNISTTTPQYWENEDIAFGYFKDQSIKYQDPNITVNFGTIRENNPVAFINGERYFAIGYPGCNHYDTRALTYAGAQNLQNKITNHQQLINQLRISPLVVTSATAVIDLLNPNNNSPLFDNGLVTYDSICAAKMSGAPLVKLDAPNNQIIVFGVNSRGNTILNQGCY